MTVWIVSLTLLIVGVFLLSWWLAGTSSFSDVRTPPKPMRKERPRCVKSF